MMLTDVRDLYRYNEWANDRMLAVIQTLTEEQYTQKLVSSFPTIRETWTHMVFAEWVWLQRWKGNSPSVRPAWSSDPTTAEQLTAVLREVEEERRGVFATMDEATLDRPLSYRNLSGDPFTNRLLDVLLHVVNHASYHRGQLTTMIRQVGGAPVSTDLIVYHRLPTARP
jgi:uncharacterized damage-inducible protein DinB